MMDGFFNKFEAKAIIDKIGPKMERNKGVLMNVENLSREELEEELGIRDVNTKFSLNEEQFRKLIESIDENGNNLLARCAYSGNLENLRILLKCAVIDINRRNKEGKTAADIALERKYYDCLLALLKEGSLFPDLSNLEMEITGHDELKQFIEEREKLHEKICEGDLESVKEITEGQDSRFLLSPKNISAMYTALSSKKWEIYAYLQYIGATFKPDDTRKSQDLSYEDQRQMNACMEEYFTESYDAHIYKLLGSTKYVQKYTNELQKKVERLYRQLDKFGSSALLMKILTYQDVDIVFDFEKRTVDRLFYCKDPALGIADSYSLRAYVAANPLKTEKDEKKVASILVHELCHLVMAKIFKNKCNPYRKNEREKEKEFEGILQDIGTKLKKEPYLHGEKYNILAGIFDYEKCYRHSELISRVYELIVLGEEMTLRKEFENLYRFYRGVVETCQNYLKHKDKFLKPVNLCQSLQETVGILPKLQSMYQTLRITKELNLDEWIEKNNQTPSSILTLKTSVPDLTCMSLYVYLRRDIKNHFSKQCIFISVNNFLKHKDIVLAALQCKACCYLVLVGSRGQRQKEVGMLIEGQISEGKRVVFIESVPAEEENTGLSYEWRDLPEEMKESLLNKDINFQGKDIKFKQLDLKEIALEIIHHYELIGLTEKKVEIGNGHYFENLPKYFIERKLQKVCFSDENKSNPNYCYEDLLKENGDIMVSDTFGSGKSTLLTYIMKTIKNKNLTLWLVRIRCQDYIQTPMEQNAISHLLETLKIVGTLEGSCLKKLLTIQGKVKIFFDGHQKLRDTDQILFLEMVQKLKQETKSQFWFFTIPEYSSLIEQENISAFKICKLEKEQQVTLLNKYREYKRSHETDAHTVKRFKSSEESETLNLNRESVGGMKSSPLLETPAEKILEYFSPEFDEMAKEVNLLILLADAFNDVGMNSNKLDILSKVVQKKISMIFHKQKVVDDAIRKPLLELYHNEHEKIAVQSIKNCSITAHADSYNNIHSVRDYIHHIGLVSPGNFEFLHSVIRHYFCVEWVNKTIERDFPINGREDENCKIFRRLLIQKLQSAMLDATN